MCLLINPILLRSIYEPCGLNVIKDIWETLSKSILLCNIYHEYVMWVEDYLYICNIYRYLFTGYLSGQRSSSIYHFVCPSVRLSLTVRFFLYISYITRWDKFLEVPRQNVMCGHMIWEGWGDGRILVSSYTEYDVWYLFTG